MSRNTEPPRRSAIPIGESRDLRIVSVCVLASEGLLGKDIASRLDLSPPQVASLLKEADDRGYISRTPRLIERNIPRRLLEEARARYSSTQLEQKLKDQLGKQSLLDTVRIARSPNYRTDPKSWDVRAHAVAQKAAERFRELLSKRRMRKVGILWGRTLRFLVDEVLASRPPRRGKKLLIVPVGGEPLSQMMPYPIQWTASELAKDLAKAVYAETVNLGPVPAFLPKKYDGNPSAVRQFVRDLRGYREIFGPPAGAPDASTGPPLVRQLDTIITSAAGIKEAFYHGSPWFRDRAVGEGCQLNELAALIVGDLGGVVFAQPGLSDSQRSLVEQMNSRCLGLTLPDLQRCARNSDADRSRRPADSKCAAGVVVVAHGRSKARVVYEATKAGCVNELVADDELGKELLTLADPPLDRVSRGH